MAGRVMDSAIRFYQKVTGSLALMLRGDTKDLDTMHALKFARWDEHETAIEPRKEGLIELLMSWLQGRKRSLVGLMKAVVVAEEGKLYDDTERALKNEYWENDR